jgi:hypothetical protein
MTVGIRRLLTSNQRIRDAFHAALHRDADLDAALAALAPDAVLLNAPMGTGARDHDGLRRYLGTALLPHLPEDLAFRRITRTVDQRRVVDEDLVAFTHDRDLPWRCPVWHRRTGTPRSPPSPSWASGTGATSATSSRRSRPTARSGICSGCSPSWG